MLASDFALPGADAAEECLARRARTPSVSIPGVTAVLDFGRSADR